MSASGPRVPLLEPEEMTPRQREVYQTIVSGPRGRVIGPLRAVILIPELADRWQRLGQSLRYETQLPRRAAELAIAMTGRRWNSQVEWQVHAGAAVAAGVDPQDIAAIGRAEPPALADAADREVYEFTRQLLMSGDVDDAVHAAVAARWGPEGAVELTAVIGYYVMVSMMLNAQAIPPIPDGGALLEAVPSRQDAGGLTVLPPLA